MDGDVATKGDKAVKTDLKKEFNPFFNGTKD